MKEMSWKVLSQLLKNSRISDRELARNVGISQPTASRTRNKLEKEGYIREYTLLPNFEKIGYQLMAVTLAKAKVTLTPEAQEKARKLILTNPEVIFVASAEGMGKNGIMLSLHRSYTDYVRFMTNLRLESNHLMDEVETMLVDLGSASTLKPPSISNLALDAPSDDNARHKRTPARRQRAASPRSSQ
jgi:DNA-binding Lrp family transcriptional regulator